MYRHAPGPQQKILKNRTFFAAYDIALDLRRRALAATHRLEAAIAAAASAGER